MEVLGSNLTVGPRASVRVREVDVRKTTMEDIVRIRLRRYRQLCTRERSRGELIPRPSRLCVRERG